MFNFNLKKIEPKFPIMNAKEMQRKMTYSDMNDDAFIKMDVNISETEIESLNLSKFKTIENNKLTKNDFVKKIKPKKNRIYKYKLFNDSNSTTTNCSDCKGIKKVTFSTVEIIRVAKYKKYNARNNFSIENIKKNIEEVKNSKKKDDIPCSIF